MKTGERRGKGKDVPKAAAAGKKSRKQPRKTVEKKVATGQYEGKNDRAAAMAAAIGRGVTMRPSKKWQAQLYYAGQSRYIGVFESREKATLAYEIAREMLKSDDAPTGGEEAERAVEAARKAAYEGANEHPNSVSKTATSSESSASSFPSPETSPIAKRQLTEDTPLTAHIPAIPSITTLSSSRLKGNLVTSETSSNNGDDPNSDRRGSMKAIIAAEILKGMVGSMCSELPEPTESTEPLDNEFNMPSWVVDGREYLPSWIEENLASFGERLVIPEFDLFEHRNKHGWKGRDLMHDRESPVRILDYYVNYGDGNERLERGGEGTTLTGIVHFSKKAESHQGFCHGGGMTSVMDDVIGWAGFLATGSCQPWTGFTAQINTSLRKPIPVDSWLLICGTIAKISGRKVSVLATLIDPGNGDAVHAECDGLVILNSGVLPDI